MDEAELETKRIQRALQERRYEQLLQSTALRQQFPLELIDADGSASSLETTFFYDRYDPYAVSAVFHTNSAGPVCWTFGRDLLIGGLDEPTGDGDVHVWPCLDGESHSVVILELCSPDGEALVQMNASDLRWLVGVMTGAMPPGTESSVIDMDSVIAEILEEGA